MKTRNFSILFVFLVTVFLTAGTALANEVTVFEPLNYRSGLAAPTLTVSTAGTTLSLSWTSVAGATGYTLSYAPAPYTGPDTIRSIPMGTQMSMSASLWEGATFFVAVQAYDSVGSSDYSNIECFVIGDIPPLAVNPSSLSLETGETEYCSVSGGTGYYDASSNDTSVAEVSISGSTLNVLGGKAGSATITVYDSASSVTTVSVTVNTNSFQFPFKISNWNVVHGDNRWGNNGCVLYSDPVLKTTDDGDYYTGFGAYTGSPFKVPTPGTYNTKIKIIPLYEWAGQRPLGSSEFTGGTNFTVDGVFYFYKYLDSQESINVFLTSMAAGQTLGYTYFTDLVYFPTIHEEISLDGFEIAKKAFEYCIQNNPN